MKAGFPLAAGDVASVLAALRSPAPALARAAYTLDELLDELVRPHGDLLAVRGAQAPAPLHDRRLHDRVDGRAHRRRRRRARSRSSPRTLRSCSRPCASSGSSRARTPATRAASRRSLGLRRASRYAVIDVGTNSVKFHVGERGADGEWRTVVDRAEVTRLGEGLDANGRAQRGADGANGRRRSPAWPSEARQDGVEAIAAVGTAGLRDRAEQRRTFVDAVRARCGVDGRGDLGRGGGAARLPRRDGRARPRRTGSLVVFDTRRRQLAVHVRQRRARSTSASACDVGAARFTERFGLDGPVSEETLAEALGAIAADLDASRRPPGRRTRSSAWAARSRTSPR